VLVSIIIPTFNEGRTIFDVLSKCLALKLEKEIIVVDNNSTDGTRSLVREFIADKQFNGTVHLLHEPVKGKGAALKRGFGHSQGEFIVFQDADCEYEPSSIPALVDQLRVYDVVFGCREGRLYGISAAAFIANKTLMAMINRRFGVLLGDIFTGQRGFRRGVLNHMGIVSTGFDVETELTIKTLRRGYRWCEINVPYSPRNRASGKTIGIRAFIQILYRYFSLTMAKPCYAVSPATYPGDIPFERHLRPEKKVEIDRTFERYHREMGGGVYRGRRSTGRCETEAAVVIGPEEVDDDYSAVIP
jgi:glycosyltransferase involved in cell wall biosynthesis